MYTLLFDNNQILFTMKIQLLPNYFKWIGLILFFAGGIPNFFEGYTNGVNDYGTTQIETPYSLSEYALIIAAIVSLLGMIIYALSKEKIEDEYINILRWESVTISFFISFVIVIANIVVYGTKGLIDAQFIMDLQLFLYLIIFFFKKRSNLTELD